MSSESQVILCPYCGHPQSVPADQPMPDQCEECGGLFEPLSRRATQISMGPWYIRNKANPFMPGCSYEVVEKMAKGGKLKPTTVLRGPTTKQFWSVARNVPGVANLLGYCHSCGTKVAPTDPKCGNCKTMFTRPKERNELGLPFKTKAEADAAQKSLDKEISAITGAAETAAPGATPPPAPTGDLLSTVLGTGMTNAVPGGQNPGAAAAPAAPVQQPFAPNAPQPGFAQTQPVQPAPVQPQPADTQPAFGQPQAAAPAAQQPVGAGQPGFGAAPQLGAQPGMQTGIQPGAQTALGANAVNAFNTASQNPGTALSDLEKKNKMVGTMTWGLIGFNAVLIIVVVVLFVMNRDKPDGSEPSKDTNTKDTSGSRDAKPSNTDGNKQSKIEFTPMKIEDKPIAVAPSINKVDDVPTPTVDPAVRIEVQEKLTQVQETWATGDLRGAQRMLIGMKDNYSQAALPTNMDQLLTDLGQQITFKDKLSEAEHLWQGGKLKEAYVVLIDVRDNYPKTWLPDDFSRYLSELRKQMKDNKIDFFGVGS